MNISTTTTPTNNVVPSHGALRSAGSNANGAGCSMAAPAGQASGWSPLALALLALLVVRGWGRARRGVGPT